MSFFGDMKNMYQMQSKAKSAQKKLKEIIIESEDTDVKVQVSAGNQVESIAIHNKALLSDEPALIAKLMEHLNKALEKAQMVAAEQMKDVLGDMDISKLLGGMGHK